MAFREMGRYLAQHALRNAPEWNGVLLRSTSAATKSFILQARYGQQRP
jgi:hypothetical protein